MAVIEGLCSAVPFGFGGLDAEKRSGIWRAAPGKKAATGNRACFIEWNRSDFRRRKRSGWKMTEMGGGGYKGTMQADKPRTEGGRGKGTA